MRFDEGLSSMRENIFEVTACENGSVTLSHMEFTQSRGYFDTWEAKTIESREHYCREMDDNTEKLCDVSQALSRAAELAETKRQKLHNAIANDVMNSIRIIRKKEDGTSSHTIKSKEAARSSDWSCCRRSDG